MGYNQSWPQKVDHKEIPALVSYDDSGAYDTTKEAKLDWIRKQVGDAYMRMKAHPNYQEPIPLAGESQISFALRAASHLVSPPQEPGESYDIECVDVSAAILAMKDDLERIWGTHKSN